MPLNIEPLHIGIIAALIIGALAWYFSRKNARDNKVGKRKADQITEGMKNLNDSNDELINNIKGDEPDVPVLEPEDAVPKDTVDKPVVEPQPEPEPIPNVVDPEPVQTQTRSESGRSAASVDSAIETVVYFTPSVGQVFTPEALQKAAQAVEAAQNREMMTIDFYDVDTGRWFHDVSMVKNCSQIYLSMLLANRTKKVDQLAASIFITLAGQMAIDLNAEADLPDSTSMVERAEHIGSIIKAFDNQLTLKIVCAHDIDKDCLAQAAADCGFSAHEGLFEKSASDSKEPVMVITPSKTLPNELDLMLDVAMVSAANDPLAQYFAVANDLCCKIDGMVTDMQGNPVEAPAAAIISQQLKELHVKMAAHGVAAGSNRALRIFSRS